MKECILQISTGHRDSVLYHVDEMLTLTDRSRNTARQIFLNEKGKEEGALLLTLLLPPPGTPPPQPGSAVAEFQMVSDGTWITVDLHVKRIEARWEHPSEIPIIQLLSSPGTDPADDLQIMLSQSNSKILLP